MVKSDLIMNCGSVYLQDMLEPQQRLLLTIVHSLDSRCQLTITGCFARLHVGEADFFLYPYIATRLPVYITLYTMVVSIFCSIIPIHKLNTTLILP